MIDYSKNAMPLDLSYLKEMTGDSAEFIIEMIDVFKEQTPIYMMELQQALEAKDWIALSNCAHKIKPTFAYLGRGDAKDHMQMIEHAARSSNVDETALTNACAEVICFTEVLYLQLNQARAELLDS